MALFAILSSFVSIGSVFANVPWSIDPMYAYDFMMYAFMHTELIVKALVIAISAMMLWMIFECLCRLRFVQHLAPSLYRA